MSSKCSKGSRSCVVTLSALLIKSEKHVTSRVTHHSPDTLGRCDKSILKSALFYLARHEHVRDLFWKFCQTIQTNTGGGLCYLIALFEKQWLMGRPLNTSRRTLKPWVAGEPFVFLCKLIGRCKAKSLLTFSASNVNTCIFQLRQLVSIPGLHVHTCHIYDLECRWLEADWIEAEPDSGFCRCGSSPPTFFKKLNSHQISGEGRCQTCDCSQAAALITKHMPYN